VTVIENIRIGSIKMRENGERSEHTMNEQIDDILYEGRLECLEDCARREYRAWCLGILIGGLMVGLPILAALHYSMPKM